jgi:hypothetical protein
MTMDLAQPVFLKLPARFRRQKKMVMARAAVFYF